jgi:hypothetical protein
VQMVPAAAFAPDPSQVPPGTPPIAFPYSISKEPDLSGKGKFEIGFLPAHTAKTFAGGNAKVGLGGVFAKVKTYGGSLDRQYDESNCISPLEVMGVRLDLCESPYRQGGGHTGMGPIKRYNVQAELDREKLNRGLSRIEHAVFHHNRNNTTSER